MTTPQEFNPTAPTVAQPEPHPQPEEATVPAAVALETEAEQLPDGYARVPLGEHATVRALTPNKWRASHLRCLNGGDLDAMAVGIDDDASGTFRPGILHDDDVQVWFDVDPTQDEINAFFEDLTAAGESLGKSNGRGRSTRRTTRR